MVLVMSFSLPVRVALNVLFMGLLVELASAVYFLSGVGGFYHRPEYLMTLPDFRQLRYESEPWGAWRVPNSVGRSVSTCFDVTYTANSYGARDKVRSLMSDKPRIVALGDSFIEGYGVETADRFSDLLEKDLGVEVLNFGVTGNFGPIQYQILYDKLASKFRHDIVLVGLLPDNDFVDNDLRSWSGLAEFKRRYRPYYCDLKDPARGACYVAPPKGPQDKTQAMGSVTFLRDLLQNTWAYGVVRQSRQLYGRYLEMDLKQVENYVGYAERDQDRLNAVLYSFRQLAEKAGGRPVVVVIIPRSMDLNYLETHPASIAGFLDNLSRIPGVEVIDLARTESFGSKPYEHYFHSCDGHWSPEGNRVVARSIAPLVRRLLDDLKSGGARPEPVSVMPSN